MTYLKNWSLFTNIQFQTISNICLVHNKLFITFVYFINYLLVPTNFTCQLQNNSSDNYFKHLFFIRLTEDYNQKISQMMSFV